MAQRSSLPPRSYSLKTFGTLTLTAEATPALAQQRQRLALLVMLAASGERGLTRDQILAYLWPESDAENARHSLEQLVHATRRALGDTVFSGVNPLSLNADVVTCDVVDFERALSRDDYAQAVALYRGPFLNGFFLDNAPEFERWTETERARLADRYAVALRQLAVNAEKTADYTTAISWWRRVVDAEPLSSRSALGLMRALVAAGDRAAALQHARVYEALVRQELESTPDPSIVTYVAALRAGAVEPVGEAPRIAATPVLAHGVSPPPSTPSPTPPSLSPASIAVSTTRMPTRRRATVAIAALALLSAAWYASAMITRRSPRDTRSLVILPFKINSADSATNYLGEAIADALSALLPGEGGLRAVEPRTAISAWKRVTAGRDGTADDARRVARELGATQALFGSLVITSGGLTLSAHVLDPDGGERQQPVRVTGPGSGDSVMTLLDAVVVQLLGGRSGVSEQTLAMLRSVPTAAWRAYFEGRIAYRQAHDAEAVRDFSRALEIDSTFALAGLDLALATLKVLRQVVCANGQCGYATMVTGLREATSFDENARFETAVRLAWQARDRLGPRDRPLLEAIRGRHWPQSSSAREVLEDLERAASAAPDRAETQYLLGVIMLYQGAALDISNAFSQAETRFVTALTLDPTYLAPLARLVDLAAYERDLAKLRRYSAAYLARDTSGATADFIRWRVAAGTDDAAGLRAIRARFDSLELTALRLIMSASQASAVALEDADRASALLIARAPTAVELQQALYDAHMLALSRGRPHLADSLLRERRKGDPTDLSFWASATLAAVFGGGIRATVDEIMRARTAWVAAHPAIAVPARDVVPGIYGDARTLGQQALWDYDRGDTASAAAAARWLDSNQFAWIGVVMDMLLATDQRRPDAAALRARVDSSVRDGCCTPSPAPPIYANLALVRAYERAGDDANALRALRRGHGIYFLATYLRKEGEIALRLKDRHGALRAFEQYLALRADPEPALHADRDSVRLLVDSLRRVR